jgi:hypothetical protein
MNEILAARNALAATLTSSAVSRSMTSSGMPWASGRAYTERNSSADRVEVTPKTRRSGDKLSWTAKPSRRNSGFQASSAALPAGARSLIRVARARAVPTGTVDVPAMRQPRCRCGG